jgi:DNA-binding NtrC family response regulator
LLLSTSTNSSHRSLCRPSTRLATRSRDGARRQRTATDRANVLIDDLRALGRRRILDALADAAGNQTRAARALGISRFQLMRRLEALGIPRPRKL